MKYSADFTIIGYMGEEEIITRWEGYFKNYEKKFIATALKVGSAMKFDADPEELKSLLLMVYTTTLLSKDKDLSACRQRAVDMQKKGIDLKFILSKTFMIFLSDMAKQAFYKENSFDALNYVVQRISLLLESCSPQEEEKSEEEDVRDIVTKLLSHREKRMDFSDADPDGAVSQWAIKFFKQIQSKGEKITLMNIYKGLNVVSHVPVSTVGKKSIVVETPPSQLGVMAIDRYTIIKHPSFGRKHLLAEVKQIDPDTRRVSLWRFKWEEEGVENRKYIRVKPKEPIEIRVKSEGGVNITGYMVDISVVGCALYIHLKDLPFKQGEKLTLELDLEDCHNKRVNHLIIKSMVSEIREFKKGNIVVFDFMLETGQDKYISAYISCRQTDIVRELNEYVSEYLS